jgi:membrane protein required for colicin V production
MTWIDFAIVIVVALSIIGGFSQGFFRSVCGLGGLLLGLTLAAWNYGHAAALLKPLVKIEDVANVIGFLAIALVVMAAAHLLGMLLSKTLHQIGLGCLDRLAGGVFGFFQGILLVTLGILVTVAFFPQTHWLTEGKLPRAFFGACHLSTHVSPEQLARRVKTGLKQLEEEAPGWMHPQRGEL